VFVDSEPPVMSYRDVVKCFCEGGAAAAAALGAAGLLNGAALYLNISSQRVCVSVWSSCCCVHALTAVHMC